MKIVQIMGSSAGGVAQHVEQITGALIDRLGSGNQVVVACPSELTTRFSSITRHLPLEISDRPQKSDIQVIREITKIAAQADILHAHGLRAAALTSMALLGQRRSKRPRFVVTLHNLPVGSVKVQMITQVLEFIVAANADVVLGVSMDIVERMAARRAKNTARALVPAPALPPIIFDREQVRENLFLDPDTKLLVTVARLAPQKGLDTLVEAAAMFNGDEDLKVRWVVAGDGPLRESTEKQIARTGAPVTLLGRRSDIGDLMNAADLVVSTAVWEGQPIAVQEALSLGAAIVATDAGGTREVTGDAAVITEVGNAQNLHERIKLLLQTPRLYNALKANALRRKDELPTLEQTIDSLLAVYQIKK